MFGMTRGSITSEQIIASQLTINSCNWRKLNFSPLHTKVYKTKKIIFPRDFKYASLTVICYTRSSQPSVLMIASN